MRKTIITPEIQGVLPTGEGWLDLEMLAQAELTSEDPTHRLETALGIADGPGWRAAEPGEQTVRLLFDRPLRITRVLLEFHEGERERTQEFLLRWSDGSTYRDIVRQQYNFNMPNGTTELEEYEVDLAGVKALELKIVPDISGGSARATVAKLRIAGSAG